MTSTIDTSAIDITKPATGNPTTQSMRDNTVAIKSGLDTAKSEISALQAAAEIVGNKDLSGGYVGKTLEKINFWNTARTFMSFFTNAATAARTWTFPDKDGTVAMTSDLPAYNCKAFVNFDGTLSGTITPRASGNIASVVKNSTGVYTITMSNALADANYVVTGSIGGTGGIVVWRTYEDSLSRTASSFKIAMYNTAGAFVDFAQCNFAVFR